MNLITELQSRIHSALAPLVKDPTPYTGMIKPTQDRKFGDFQVNCAMSLGKKLGKSPRDVAAEIVANLDVAPFCEAPEIAGPGFINLTLNQQWLTDAVNSALIDDRMGVKTVSQSRNIIVDFSSPNVAKPMHVGHLRSSVIGDALYKILGFLGHKVTSDNHIGDWGTQFGMIIYGYKNFLNADAYQESAVGELARLYRLVNQVSDYLATKKNLPTLQVDCQTKIAECQQWESQLKPDDKKGKKELKKRNKEIVAIQGAISKSETSITEFESDNELVQYAKNHPEIAKNARLETAKLHQGDDENLKLWNQFMPVCLGALQIVYDRLNIKFDLTLGESYYQPHLAGVVKDLKDKNIAVESDGAMCVFVDGKEAPFLIQKADGAFTYGTTDLATVKARVEEHQADAILYVVDSRQGEHFQLLFDAVRLWGYSEVELNHVKFGTVMGNDGKPFKTRSGDNIGLESLLDEAVIKAREIVEENDNRKNDPALQLSEEQKQNIAQYVGIGGIKFADLKHNRESDYIFDWEKMLALTGETAAYIQYAYARIAGIFRKGELNREQFRNSGAQINIVENNELLLAKQLLAYQETLDTIGDTYQPHLLNDYLFKTANALSSFYSTCPVLKAEDQAVRESRLLLIDLTARILQHGLSLLGIETAEQM